MDWHCADAIVSLSAKIASTVGGLIAVFGAVFVYNRNSRVRRAEWLASLYEKFYEKPEFRDIREILDCDARGSNEITAVLESERRDFTDYLNFFEFVAVLRKSNQLTNEEIEDLFCYYLDCLERNAAVRK